MDDLGWMPVTGIAAFAAAAWRAGRWREFRQDRILGEHEPGELLVRFRYGLTKAVKYRIHRLCGGQVLDERYEGRLHHVRAQSSICKTAHQLRKAYQKHPEVEYAEPNYIYRSCLQPDDPYYSLQYGTRLIHADQAWDKAVSDPSVVIAVLDTGVDSRHPDLKEKLLPGKNFVQPGQLPEDSNGHGTHVAGIAAAMTDNSAGIAGIAPGAALLPVCVLDKSGAGTLINIEAGIRYAADQGAQVINLSLGGAGNSQVLREAIHYAAAKGVIIVAAAGNDGTSAPVYPAAYEDVISVGSVGESDSHSAFSAYGDWVDIAAPGDLIVSTGLCGRYMYMSGTSMASAHVAGAAALLAGQGLSAAVIRERLLAAADPIEGTGVYWMSGRLNAERAVSLNEL